MKKTREQGNFSLRSRTGGAFAAHTADALLDAAGVIDGRRITAVFFQIDIRSTMLRVTFLYRRL